jgi:hypothetical protein
MKKTPIAATALAGLMLAGCVSTPDGPTVPVMPAQGKPFAEFQRDEYDCTQYADSKVAGRAQAANDRAVRDTVIGAALGTAVGAAFNRRNGAGPGAAVGAVLGAGVASDDAAYSQMSLQGRYNMAYAQCMTSKGNVVDAGPPRYRHRYRDYGPPPPPPPGY